MRPAAIGEMPVVECPISKRLIALTIEILDLEAKIHAKELDLVLHREYQQELLLEEKRIRARLSPV